MAENEIEETQEKKGLNFVEQMVWDDLQAGKNGGRLNTHRSLTDTSILGMLKRSAWTSA